MTSWPRNGNHLAPRGAVLLRAPPTRGRDTPEADSELPGPRRGSELREARRGPRRSGSSRRSRGTGAATASARHRRTYRHTRTDRQTGSARQQTLRPRVGSDQIRLGAVLFDKLMQLAERNGLQDLLQATHPRTETAVSLKARCRHVRKLVSVLLLSFANFPKIL